MLNRRAFACRDGAPTGEAPLQTGFHNASGGDGARRAAFPALLALLAGLSGWAIAAEAFAQAPGSRQQEIAAADLRDRSAQSLLDTAAVIQRSERLLSGIEGRLGELDAQEKLLRGSLAQRHDSIARLLAAMQRMGHNPPPVLITKREDALTMVRSAMILASAFPELKSQAMELGGKLTELARVMGEIKAEGERLRTETARLSDSRTKLSELMERRRSSPLDNPAEVDAARRRASEIAKSVQDITDLIGKLDKSFALPAPGKEPPSEPPITIVRTAPVPPASTGKAGAPDNVAAAPSAEADVRSNPAPPPAAVPAPAAKQQGEQVAALRPTAPSPGVEIAPTGSEPLRRDFAMIEPSVSFIQLKGRLAFPASGRRVLGYGDKTQHGSQSKGIVLETRHSAQVTAPADGRVIFAGPFRSFGQLLIIDAGQGYHILLAGLSQIDVQPRQSVLAGEPVGVMNAPTKMAAANAAEGAPVLYIEFRKDNKPIDPDPWWLVEVSQKVQG